jgi:hypothetical protein
MLSCVQGLSVPEGQKRPVLPSRHSSRLILSSSLQLYMPSTGYVNNCDGGRSHTYCDYRQQ